jgi:regulatory protein
MNADIKAAYSAALRMLTRREHCEAEVRSKLQQRGFDEIASECAVEELKNYGYLSESRYAEAFLRYRMQRGEAPWMAAVKAAQRGVDETALQVALEEAEASFDVAGACRELLHRRDPERLRRNDKRVWQRHARFLRNRGYDAATILAALNDVD